MPLFEFKAINTEGKTYTGTQDSSDRYTLGKEFRDKGETLISAEQTTVKGARGTTWLDRVNAKLTRVKLRDKVLFARNLAAMLSAGLPLSRALSVLQRQTTNPRFKQILQQLNDAVQKGDPFSTALAGFPDVFPKILVSMVHAGEESGRLADSLSAVGIQMEEDYQLRKRIKGAMTYPSVVVGAMVIVGILMLIFVVPTLTSTFTDLNVELPKSTQFIVNLSEFFSNSPLMAVGILVSVVIVFIIIIKTPKGRRAFEWILLRLPVVKNIVKEKNSAQTARTFGSLLVSGVEVVQALEITEEVVQNSFYKDVIRAAAEVVEKGQPISETFMTHDKVYPVLVGEMMSVGEEVGDLPQMLERIAVFYEGEVKQKTKDLSTIIEPFLMIVIGAVVGFFAVSMITPIYSLSSSI